MKFVSLLLLPSFLLGQSSDQRYVWPTDASRLITSSFGEYRSNHIHAGLDVKTWGSEGWKVFAMDSGSVVRVEASPYSYGRALVIRLHDGRKALYAHLSRFAEPIEDILGMEQRRVGRFGIALEFEPGFLPVTRGETVAFTGSTGAGGGPHLHFEVWDRNGDALNPLSLGFEVMDGIPPTLKALAFTPLDFGSFVEGDFETRIVPLRKAARGKYTVTSKIRVWGNIGIELLAFDMLNGVASRIAPYGTRLFVDRRPVFSKTFDRFPQSITRQIRLERDYRLDLRGKGIFEKLYVDEGNTLPFYRPSAFRSGVLCCWDTPGGPHGSIPLSEDIADSVSGPCPLSPGDHAFRIETFDYSGNSSVATGTLSMTPLSKMAARTDLPKPGWSGGMPGRALPPHADVQREFIGDCLRFQVVFDGPVADFPTLVVGLNGWSRTRVELLPKSAKEFIGVMPLDENAVGTMTTELRYASDTGMGKKVFDTLQVYCITPDYGGTMFSPDGIFRIDVPPRSLYKSVWGTIRMEPVSEKMFGLGRRYWVEPADLSPGNAVKLVFDPGGTYGREAETGIYGLRRYGGLSCLDSRWENGQLTAWTRELTKFSLYVDTIPPALWGILPAPNAVLDRKLPMITIRFSDGLSGIRDEENYGTRLDGVKLVMEYSPRRGKAFHRITSPLAPGRHVLEAWARDHAGNLTENRREFFVR